MYNLGELKLLFPYLPDLDIGTNKIKRSFM